MFANLELAIKAMMESQIRIEEKLDLILANSPEQTPPPAEDSFPARTADMILYQPSWKDVVLSKPGDSGLTGLQWTRGNQTPLVGDVSVNTPQASSNIVGDFLRLHLAPDKPFDQVGAKLVLTTELTQWTTLQPYANSVLHMRFDMGFLGNKLPVFDMSGAGRWVTLAQWKSKPEGGALIQLNMDENYCLWLGTSSPDILKAIKFTDVPAFKAGLMRSIDIKYYMTSRSDGYFKLFLDEKPIAELRGVTAGLKGYVSHHFAFYTNALSAPADLDVGGVIISKAPIP